MTDRSNPGPSSRAREALSWLWASCERVSISESESLDENRPLSEQLAVKAHLLCCPGCRRFRSQRRSLVAVLSRLRARKESRDKLPGVSLPPHVRERIKARSRSAGEPGGSSPSGEPSD
jgi:predicted anti-sigma-YlaC factor YlaD